MAYSDKIIEAIDNAIVASALTDSRFQKRHFAGLCFLTVAKLKEANTPVILPAKVSTVGECEFIVPDDNFNLITYHRILTNTYIPAVDQFGKGSNLQLCTTDALLTVIGFTKPLRLTAEQLEALFMAGFPNIFTQTFRDSIQMKSLYAQVISSNFDSNQIFNTEYRGETYFLKPETVMFQIRYRVESKFAKDCFEICCEPEEEEAPAPVEGGDITLTESEYTIPLEFASTTTTDMFFRNTDIGKDVGTDPVFDTLQLGRFKSMYAHGGAFTKVAHVIINDTDRIGGAGNGWNPINPDCVTLPLTFGGELCQDFRYNGEPVDFYNSHIDLVALHGMQNIVSANITDGTIEEVYWQIDRTIAVTGQTIIPIIFGLESPTTTTGDLVAIKTCDWIELIEVEYPAQQFIFVFDAAALWSPSGGETAYNAALLANITVDMSKVAIRLYCHGFKLWEGLMNGDATHDTAIVDTGMTVTLPAFTAAVASSAFADCPVYIAQLSSHYFFGEAYNSEVIKGLYYLCSAYPRMIKHFIEQARDGGIDYFGVAPAGVNQWMNDHPSNLDFKFFTIINRLITAGTTALTITYTEAEVDMYGGKRGASQYCLIIQNRGAAVYILPSAMTLDGVTTNIEVEFSIGEYCDAIDSDNSTTYTPGLTLNPRSINYLEISSIT